MSDSFQSHPASISTSWNFQITIKFMTESWDYQIRSLIFLGFRRRWRSSKDEIESKTKLNCEFARKNKSSIWLQGRTKAPYRCREELDCKEDDQRIEHGVAKNLEIKDKMYEGEQRNKGLPNCDF